ncbi:MAG TPA: diiron oxygenase [Thermoanaerobaculia bacterium]|nr:diiron oxygenase [Thermoanaerobaculia bacterium]
MKTAPPALEGVKAPSGPAYTPRLEDWYQRATVRVKPRRILREEEEMGKVYFSPDLLPFVHHPLLRERGPRIEREVLIRHLYHYLGFTCYLEHELVNIAARRIAGRDTDFELPPQMLFDAHKLYTDEGYHALFSEDMKLQIVAATGVLPLRTGPPQFLRWLRRQQEGHPPEAAAILETFAAVVAETLISATLVQLPRDERVVTAVRELVTDHAEDEAIHHHFFAALFRIAWPQLSARQREIVAPLLASFMLEFLQPDLPSIRHNLAAAGLNPQETELVLASSYPPDKVLDGIRRTARMTLRLFATCGLDADPRAADAFTAAGLSLSAIPPLEKGDRVETTTR